MYSKGDMVFYSSTGVCEVVDVGLLDVRGMPDDKEFYTLCPVSASHREMIYIPVDIKKGIRSAITADEATRYIEMIHEIQPVSPESHNPKAVSDFYSQLIGTYDCENLLAVIISLSVKKRECEEKKKRLNQTQASYLFKAQDMIYDEFALALGKSKDDIRRIIESEISNL